MKLQFSLLLITICFLKTSFAQSTIGMFSDLDHAPFIYGVASGDPLPNSVLIWTALETPTSSNPINIKWELALDKDFCFVTQDGINIIDATTDWTLTLDVQNLNSFTTYYYRFFDEQGNCSVIGRTRTAPQAKECEHFRFGVVSCASLYSGYFNGYKRLAERTDIDGVINLGDYIYDFVDGDEEVRVPSPYFCT